MSFTSGFSASCTNITRLVKNMPDSPSIMPTPTNLSHTLTDEIISIAINGKSLNEIEDDYLYLIVECIQDIADNVNIEHFIHSSAFLKQLILFIMDNKDNKKSSTKLIYIVQLLSAILNIRFNQDIISKEFIITLIQLLNGSNLYLIQRLLRLFCIIVTQSKVGKYLLIKHGMIKYLAMPLIINNNNSSLLILLSRLFRRICYKKGLLGLGIINSKYLIQCLSILIMNNDVDILEPVIFIYIKLFLRHRFDHLFILKCGTYHNNNIDKKSMIQIINNYFYDIDHLFPALIIDIIFDYIGNNIAGLTQINRFVQLISYQHSLHFEVPFCCIQCLILLIGNYITTKQLRDFGLLKQLKKLIYYLSINIKCIDDKQGLIINAIFNLIFDYIYLTNDQKQIIELMEHPILIPLISILVKTEILSTEKIMKIKDILTKLKTCFDNQHKAKWNKLFIQFKKIYNDKDIELGNKRIVRQWLTIFNIL